MKNSQVIVEVCKHFSNKESHLCVEKLELMPLAKVIKYQHVGRDNDYYYYKNIPSLQSALGTVSQYKTKVNFL